MISASLVFQEFQDVFMTPAESPSENFNVLLEVSDVGRLCQVSTSHRDRGSHLSYLQAVIGVK